MRNYFKLTVLILILFLINGCSTSSALPYINLTNESEHEDSQVIEEENAIRLGIASVISPQASRIGYENLVKYLEEKLQVPIIITQGETYAETNQLIKEGKVDVALICSLAYVLGIQEDYMDGIAAPVVAGNALYRSYTIVLRNSGIDELEDLRGKKFAFTDPDSYSGRLAMLNKLSNNGESAETFFGEIFFTYSHDYSVKSVALGIVDGATVDSLVYDQMQEINIEDVSNIKIIGYGEWVGTPPIVVSKFVTEDFKNEITAILNNMHNDPKGKKVLDDLHIEKFTSIDYSTYKPIEEMIINVGEEDWLN